MTFPISIRFLFVIFLAGTPVSAIGNQSRRLSDINTINSAVQTYKMITGSLPDPQLGIGALVERPDTLGPEREWAKLFMAVPLDPWGHEYQYVAGSGYPDGFGIYSTGPDGVSETQGNDSDDSNSWSEDNRGIQEGMGRHWQKIALMVAGASLFGLLCGVVLARLKNKQTLA